MFANMFFKTEPISYRVYSYDTDRQEVLGSNLRSSFVNAQKFNVEDIVRSSTYLIKTSPFHRQNILSKYDIRRSSDYKSIVITDKSDYNKSVTVSLRKESGKYIQGGFGQNNPELNEFKKQIIEDLLMFVVPDTYEQVGKSMENDG
jgi:hypothetical protein